MPSKRDSRRARKPNQAEEWFGEGYARVSRHPLFSPLAGHVWVKRQEKGNLCPPDGWAVVTRSGVLHVHPDRKAPPEHWAWIIAHCLLHLGFGHFFTGGWTREWNAACDCVVARFLADLKFGRPPDEMAGDLDFPARDEERLAAEFRRNGIPDERGGWGVAGKHPDLLFVDDHRFGREPDWPNLLAQGLAQAVAAALDAAAGRRSILSGDGPGTLPVSTEAQAARSWFLSSFPLLGSLAAAFTLCEDPLACHRLSITVAAVDSTAKVVYLNPAAGLDRLELRFVIAHELLHVGLRHDVRCGSRDPFLWNVACDYVINGWLVEMGLGDLPQIGVLYDPELKGLSAEAVYERLARDLRRLRRLATLRGNGLGDILGDERGCLFGGGVDLDGFYRRALSQGLQYHQEQGRGFLPAGLIEEIQALGQPPIPWDVELAQWFDHWFAPVEKRRSYARPSRRQSASPEIPRPRWVLARGALDGRTFGVVLDTSGSMDRKLLGMALGAVVSYSLSREVPAIRVVFCDAVAYDQGYMVPEALAHRVQVKGRGGTVLQPGIDLLERATDFPPDGPILVITDGFCDQFRIRRPHAILLPAHRLLPFPPKGPVFRIRP